MTTHIPRTASAEAEVRVHGRRFDASRLVGVAFLVFFGAGFVILVLPPNTYTSTAADWAAAHGAEPLLTLGIVCSTFLFPLAGIFLVWSAARLRGALRTDRDADVMAGRLALFGAAFAAIGTSVAAGAAAAGSHMAAGGDTGGFAPEPAVGLGLSMLGSQVFNPSQIGLSVVLIALGVGLRRAHRLPGWLAWAGYVLAPVLPIAWVLGMIPLFLAVTWVATVTAMVNTEPHAALRNQT